MISLESLFSRQPAPLLGIDISSSSVKLVELGRDKAGALVLERCAIEPLERGWITDGNIEKFDEVAEALRRLVKKKWNSYQERCTCTASFCRHYETHFLARRHERPGAGSASRV